jgi:hypothetical protein
MKFGYSIKTKLSTQYDITTLEFSTSRRIFPLKYKIQSNTSGYRSIQDSQFYSNNSANYEDYLRLQYLLGTTFSSSSLWKKKKTKLRI